MAFRVCVFIIGLLSILLPGFASAETGAPVIAPWNQKQERFVQAYQGDIDAPRLRGNVSGTMDMEEQQGRNAPLYPGTELREKETFGDKKKNPPSALEDLYSKRTGTALSQYGYDMFGIPEPGTEKQLDSAAMQNQITPPGAVQGYFILGHGDEVEIVFMGQRSDREKYTVNDEGLLLIKDFPPIPAAGRSIGQVRLSIEAAASNLHNTQAHVSLASVRQINALVIGHIKKPGRQTLTVFHTVLDALMAAGGIQKTGSLRGIKLVRGGQTRTLDMYDLLMGNDTGVDISLRDGDRIIVPAIGPTIAVSGEAKRPGIYEIKKGQHLRLKDALALGGDVLSPGKNRFLKLGITRQGREKIQDVSQIRDAVFSGGDVLVIAKGTEKRAGTVALEGHTRRPGLYALDETQTLSALITDEDILDADIYPLIGVIKRWDPAQLVHTLISYSPRLVLKGEYDRKLHEGDTVYLFSMAQVEALFEHETEKEETVIPVRYTPQKDEENGEKNMIEDEIVASFLRERAAFVRGAVRKPGAYPLADGETLASLLAAAGGMTIEANTGNIEVTSDLQGEGHQAHGRSGTRRIRVNLRETRPEDILIGPGDAIRINQKFKKIEDKSVLIMGEVINPGRYDLIPGDKVSDLLERAGGFSRQAYPDGAIFSRKSERLAEEARFKAQAREIKQAVAAALEADDEKVNAGKIAEARALASELESAEGVGRITVEADLAMLKTQPELDMLLEPGDRLYIPKRSLSVRVRGEVLSPASLQFRQGKDPLDYIHEAGSFTHYADKDRAFVLYPDGSAQPLQVSAWNHRADFIPPGSTIIVPRDPEPFDFIESAKDISQILSNLAITAIFIDDVRDDD